MTPPISSNSSNPQTLPLVPETAPAENSRLTHRTDSRRSGFQGAEPARDRLPRALRDDFSAWIPPLWRNPGGGGEPDFDGETGATETLERAVTVAEGMWRGVSVGLGLETEAVPPPPQPVAAYRDAPVTTERVIEEFLQLEKVSEAERERLWTEAIRLLRQQGTPCPEEVTGNYADFRRALEALGPRLPARVISLRHALTLLAHRETLGSEPVDRPIALVIEGTADHNGAFTAGGGFPLLDRLEASGHFHVLYYEVDADEDPEDILAEVRRRSGHRIHTLILAGHGNPSMMSFSGADPGASEAAYEETDYLDSVDFLSGEIASWDEYLDPDGQVLLLSCSNGAGGEANPYNMANCVARAVPGRPVYSTEAPGNIDALVIREDLSLDITWDNALPYVARSEDGSLPETPRRDTAQNS